MRSAHLHELLLRVLVSGIDAIDPLDTVEVALVHRVHSDPALVAIWTQLAVHTGRRSRGARDGASAEHPHVGPGTAQVVQLTVRNPRQALGAGFPENVGCSPARSACGTGTTGLWAGLLGRPQSGARSASARLRGALHVRPLQALASLAPLPKRKPSQPVAELRVSRRVRRCARRRRRLQLLELAHLRQGRVCRQIELHDHHPMNRAFLPGPPMDSGCISDSSQNLPKLLPYITPNNPRTEFSGSRCSKDRGRTIRNDLDLAFSVQRLSENSVTPTENGASQSEDEVGSVNRLVRLESLQRSPTTVLQLASTGPGRDARQSRNA